MPAQTVSFQAVDFGPIWLLGKQTTVQQGKTAVKFVTAFRRDGSNDYLQSLPERVSPKGDIIIWMGGYDPASKSFTEIPGVFVRPGCRYEGDYAVRELPACTMGVCSITGPTRDLSRGAHNKLLKAMQQAGYAPDYSPGYSMEYYSYELYEQDRETYTFSYYLPCRRLEVNR